MPDAVWVAQNVSPQRVVLRTDSMTAQIEAARAGLGVLLGPERFAELPGLTGVQMTPKLRKRIAASPGGSLWLVGHRAMREVPRIAAVWEWLREQFVEQDAR